MMTFMCCIFALGVWMVVRNVYHLYRAKQSMKVPPMVDSHDAMKTAEEMRRRFKMRVYGTDFFEPGDPDLALLWWKRRLLSRKGEHGLVGLVLLCHMSGCEIVLEDDTELTEEQQAMSWRKREYGDVYESRLPAMTYERINFAILCK